MTEKQRDLAEIAIAAIHKVAIEIGRGTASPRCEYEAAIERLDEMRREFRR